MSDIANVTIVGRLTRNPETVETPSSSVTKFSLAVNGFKKEDVSFFDCEAWGNVGKIVQDYCEKGKQVAVNGTIRIDRWEKDGAKRSKPVINVRDVTLLGSKNDESSTKEEKSSPVKELINDDIPF